jgi:glycosyltransferase involved in cell wall biosynthesis
VHFIGRVPYSVFQQVLSISKAHVYLTYPFVLSWSMLEAMSHECLLIASRTTPVTEVLEDGKNGRMVDFFKHGEIADAVVAALENPDATIALRKAARRTIEKTYDLKQVCLPAQIDLINLLAEGGCPPPTEDRWTGVTAT